MFKEALQEIVDKTDGGFAGLLMDSAGVTIDSYAKADALMDINAVGVEFGILINSIKKAAESLEAGNPQEIAIATDKMTTIIRPIGDGYFLALTLHPGGNFGKGRYLMRIAVPALLKELS